MDSTFRDMIAEGWLIIYMDNVLVFAKTLEECQEQTKQVLKWMQEEDLHLKLAKCAFNQIEVLCFSLSSLEPLVSSTTWTILPGNPSFFNLLNLSQTPRHSLDPLSALDHP